MVTVIPNTTSSKLVQREATMAHMRWRILVSITPEPHRAKPAVWHLQSRCRGGKSDCRPRSCRQGNAAPGKKVAATAVPYRWPVPAWATVDATLAAWHSDSVGVLAIRSSRWGQGPAALHNSGWMDGWSACLPCLTVSTSLSDLPNPYPVNARVHRTGPSGPSAAQRLRNIHSGVVMRALPSVDEGHFILLITTPPELLNQHLWRHDHLTDVMS